MNPMMRVPTGVLIAVGEYSCAINRIADIYIYTWLYNTNELCTFQCFQIRRKIFLWKFTAPISHLTSLATTAYICKEYMFREKNNDFQFSSDYFYCFLRIFWNISETNFHQNWRRIGAIKIFHFFFWKSP